MSIDIKLGNFLNRKNELRKDVNWGSLGPGLTYTGTLKNETSITDPVILVEGDIATLGTFNYMYISAFYRYYFITNIKQIRTGLVEISAHVDVLTSFRTEIREQRGIVERRQAGYNLYLNDGSIHVYQNRAVINYPFPGNDFDNKTGSYILALAGS